MKNGLAMYLDDADTTVLPNEFNLPPDQYAFNAALGPLAINTRNRYVALRAGSAHTYTGLVRLGLTLTDDELGRMLPLWPGLSNFPRLTVSWRHKIFQALDGRRDLARRFLKSNGLSRSGTAMLENMVVCFFHKIPRLLALLAEHATLSTPATTEEDRAIDFLKVYMPPVVSPSSAPPYRLEPIYRALRAVLLFLDVDHFHETCVWFDETVYSLDPVSRFSGQSATSAQIGAVYNLKSNRSFTSNKFPHGLDALADVGRLLGIVGPGYADFDMLCGLAIPSPRGYSLPTSLASPDNRSKTSQKLLWVDPEMDAKMLPWWRKVTMHMVQQPEIDIEEIRGTFPEIGLGTASSDADPHPLGTIDVVVVDFTGREYDVRAVKKDNQLSAVLGTLAINQLTRSLPRLPDSEYLADLTVFLSSLVGIKQQAPATVAEMYGMYQENGVEDLFVQACHSIAFYRPHFKTPPPARSETSGFGVNYDDLVKYIEMRTGAVDQSATKLHQATLDIVVAKSYEALGQRDLHWRRAKLFLSRLRADDAHHVTLDTCFYFMILDAHQKLPIK